MQVWDDIKKHVSSFVTTICCADMPGMIGKSNKQKESGRYSDKPFDEVHQ